jgi:uncharacterized protein (TIGR02452 family)
VDIKQRKRAIAQETVRILDAGFYEHPRAGRVAIAEDLARAVAGTRLYRPEDTDELLALCAARAGAGLPEISVVNQSTLEAARADCLALNFASAKNPGGGFLGGAEAQEESLARSSGLYPCLLAQQGYYAANRRCGTCLYTDHAIYSPRVPVIRDDQGALLERPYPVTFLTAPAPNAGAVRADERGEIDATLVRRMRVVLAIAAVHGHRDLVLGAWGCGVFRNDPALVARRFGEALTDPLFAGAFDRVVFAVLDRSGDRRIAGAFEEAFRTST